MNVLGHMLNRGAEENQFGYHHRCSRLRLTHLCFADDLLIFAEGSPRSVAGVLSILDQFKQMSGLAINIQKTSLFHSCGRSWTDWNQNRSQTCKASCPVFGGFPLTSKKLSMSDCQPFIERVRGKQQAWTVKHLSYAGRVQLLKSVIAGLINFRSSVFILPKKCIKMVDLIDFVRLSSGRALHCLQLAHVSLGISRGQRMKEGWGLRIHPPGTKLVSSNLSGCFSSGQDQIWVAWIKDTRLRPQRLKSGVIPREGFIWKHRWSPLKFR